MVDQYDPGCFGVRLANREQREKWDILVRLKVIPSRYPDEEALEALGLGDCFWELSRVGGLTKLFKGKWPSYRHLTLEFLSTLKVTRVGIIPRIQEIKFRLGNVDYEMSVEELNHMLDCEGIVISMPDKFDMDGFWTAITFLWEGKRVAYSEGRAKSISIRNPVLRYLQMACAFLPLARKETKGVASSELFLLWNILNRRALNMGSFIISHLQIQARKTSGTLACGGIITAIAELCKINAKRLEPMKDKGEMFLSFEVLKEIELITVDSRQRVFFIQEAGDHFPLPNPSYTYVHGWHITKNWRLNSDAHKAIVKATPAYVPLNPQYRPGIPFQSNPQSMRPDLALLPHQAPPQEEHAHDDQGPSQQRRTRRRTGPQHADDADDVSLAERVDHLGTRIDHVEASMRQHLEQLTQRFDHYHKVNDERWGRVENTVGEMLRRFQTFPNPLLPPSQ
ncbi:uncharacterized protein LOC121773859 [Salvia splendens]|uniref:uncharacterized protein LOC121773859 n=1 Tax=Salvia splendens TaxID=180675 RepID=UPI001C272A46|nr:uncharacterized protein LOC121773859 [Salvia splendens]XP_042026711.1 uncharacterized protein LOC121773859 [Salvia splendens]